MNDSAGADHPKPCFLIKPYERLMSNQAQPPDARVVTPRESQVRSQQLECHAAPAFPLLDADRVYPQRVTLRVMPVTPQNPSALCSRNAMSCCLSHHKLHQPFLEETIVFLKCNVVLVSLYSWQDAPLLPSVLCTDMCSWFYGLHHPLSTVALLTLVHPPPSLSLLQFA
jgi:hypothetical protein